MVAREETRFDPAEPLIRDYLSRCLAGRAEGVEEFFGAHPEVGPLLRRRLERLRAMGLLASGAVDGAPFGIPGRFDDYQILEPLGSGGMGIVYRARQFSLQREVAIKVLGGLSAASPRLRERFEREIASLARMRHPHIVAVHGTGTVSGAPYVVMERVEGQPLSALLPAPGLAPTRPAVARAVALCAKIARALEHAHDLGVVHRDVKPGNILVDERGEPRLIDFGLVCDDGAEALTAEGEFVGTLAYTAPEQALGRRVDRRADVFGLGATLFHLLTGRPPYAAATISDLVSKLRDGPPPRPRVLNPRLPAALSTVLEHALAPEPSERYGSCADFADDLEAVLEDRPIRARGLSSGTRILRWMRRRKLAAALVLMTALAAVLGIAVGAKAWQASREARARALRSLYRALESQCDLEAAVNFAAFPSAERDLVSGGLPEIDTAAGRTIPAQLSEATRPSAEIRQALDHLLAELPDDPEVWLLAVQIELPALHINNMAHRRTLPQHLDAAREVLRRSPEAFRSEPAGRFLSELLSGVDSEERLAERAVVLNLANGPAEGPQAIRRARALHLIRRYRGRADLEQLRAIVAARPDDVEALRYLALWTQDSTDFFDHHAAFTALAHLPEDPWLLSGTALHCLNQARRLDDPSLYREAVRLARAALELGGDAENAALINNGAHVLDLAGTFGDQAEAERWYRKVIESGRRYPPAHWNLKNLLLSKLNSSNRAEVCAEILVLLRAIEAEYAWLWSYWRDLAWAEQQVAGVAKPCAESVQTLERALDLVAPGERFQIVSLLVAYLVEFKDAPHFERAKTYLDELIEVVPRTADGLDSLLFATPLQQPKYRTAWRELCIAVLEAGGTLGKASVAELRKQGVLAPATR